jgi:hypothetical protein
MVDSSPYGGLMEGVQTMSLLILALAGKAGVASLNKT